MGYENLSREQLIARIEALEAERRAATSADRPRHELRPPGPEVERQSRPTEQAQEPLAQPQARPIDLDALARVAYLTLDREAVVVDIDPRGAALLGVESAAAVGQPLFALARFVDAAAFRAYLSRCESTGAPAVERFRFTTPRGAPEVEAIATALRSRAGELVSIHLALLDLDVGPERTFEHDLERARSAERDLRTTLERLAHASFAMNEVIAQMKDGRLAPVLQVLVDEARGLIGAEYAALGVGGTHEQPFDPWVFSGMPEDVRSRIGRLPRAVGLLRFASHLQAPLRLRDIREHPAFGGLPAHHPAIKSFLCAPIRYRGRVLGTLYLANKVGAAEFSESDEVALTLLVRSASTALEIARVLRLERRRRDLFETASRVLDEQMGTARLLESVADVVVHAFGDVCAVALFADDGSLRVAALRRLAPSREGGAALGTRVCLPADLRDDVLVRCLPRTLRRAPAGTETILDGPTLLVPLHHHGRVLGLLHVARSELAGLFDEEDLTLAFKFGRRAAIALENARLRETANRAYRARDEMLALVTHDLRNLLGTLSISTSVLKKGAAPQGERRRGAKHVDAIGRAIARMRALLDTLRDVGMIEAGTFRVDATPQDVRDVLAEAAAMLEPRADDRHVRLWARAAEDLPHVACDRERIHQVLANLVSNAIEHTPEGGTIMLDASLSEQGVRVAVSDTGSGIAPQDLPHVFERYWRTNPSARTGTGLGLFIARGIVRAHGADISVESELGHGSTFVFTLPRASSSEVKATARAPIEGSGQPSE